MDELSLSRPVKALKSFNIRSDFPAEIFEKYRYCPDTGGFTILKSYHSAKIGRRADVPDKYGYRRVIFKKREYLAHRLAWLFTFGEMPCALIDHVNGDRSDNRIENLRLATPAENMFHRRRSAKRRSSLPKGVALHRTGRFQAQIGHNKRTIYLGLYDTPEQAEGAYRKAELDLFGEFARAL